MFEKGDMCIYCIEKMIRLLMHSYAYCEKGRDSKKIVCLLACLLRINVRPMPHLPTFSLPTHKRLEFHEIWNMSICRVLLLGFEADELLRALAQEWFPDVKVLQFSGQTCFCPDLVASMEYMRKL